jgi:hypothetical protein
LLSCGRWNVGFTRSASTAARPLGSRVRDSVSALLNTQLRKAGAGPWGSVRASRQRDRCSPRTSRGGPARAHIMLSAEQCQWHCHFCPFFNAVCSLDEKCGCLETQRDLSHKPLNIVPKELLYLVNCAGCRDDGDPSDGIKASSEEMVVETEPRTVAVPPIMRAISFEKNFLFSSLPFGIRFFGRHGRKVDA